MLGSFRKLGGTWFVKGFLLILVASFGLWGIGGYLSGSTSSTALSVGEMSYSAQHIAQAYEEQLNQLSQRAGQQITKETALQMGLPSYVLGQLMQEASLLTTANELDIVAAPTLVKTMIQSIPDFRGEDGSFDVNTYRRMLRTIGMTPEKFEKEQAQNIKMQTLARLFAAPPLPQKITDKQQDLLTTFAHISYISIQAADLPDMAMSEDEVQAYFQANQSRYATPEVRDIDVLTLDIPTFAKNIELTEADLQNAYDNMADSLASPEKRRIRYLLFPTQPEAEAAAKKLAEGATFASFKPIDMGLVEQNALPEEFAKAVFSETAKIGEATPVFKGPVGFHIAMVDEVIPSSTPSFADAKETLERQLRSSRALDTQLDVLEQVEDLLASGATLQDVAEAVNLPLETQTKVTQQDIAPTEQRAFTLAENQPSEVITLDDESYMVLQARNIQPSQIPELADIRKQVTADAMLAKKKLALKNAVKDAIEATNERGLAFAGRPFNLPKIKVEKGISQDMNWLSDDYQQLLLSKETGFILGTVENGTLYLVRLESIETPDLPQATKDAIMTQLNRSMGLALSEEFLTASLHNMEISYHLPLLRQIFGEGFDEQMIPRP